ncbi:uncharacterized protein ACR2FA_002193 [Aphomia sociella]
MLQPRQGAMTARPRPEQAPLEKQKVVRTPSMMKTQMKPTAQRQGPLAARPIVKAAGQKKVISAKPSPTKPSTTKLSPVNPSPTKPSPAMQAKVPAPKQDALAAKPTKQQAVVENKVESAKINPPKPSPAKQTEAPTPKQGALAAKPTKQQAVVENKVESAKINPPKPSPAKETETPTPKQGALAAKPTKQQAVVENKVESAKTNPPKPSPAKQTEAPKQTTQKPPPQPKVRHEVPDEPSTDAETTVVKESKTDIVDDVSKVVGLNVEKRLDVHNPLKVTIQFSAPPKREDLRAFLKKYYFMSIQRNQSAMNTFEGEVKTIEAFDALRAVNELYCGSVIIKVSTNYQFTQCPSKLKTDYYDETKHSEEILESDKAITKTASSDDSIKVVTPNIKAEDKSQLVENTNKTVKEKSINAAELKEKKLCPVKIKEEKSPIKPVIKSVNDQPVLKSEKVTDTKEKTVTKEVKPLAKVVKPIDKGQSIVKSEQVAKTLENTASKAEKTTNKKSLAKDETNSKQLDKTPTIVKSNKISEGEQTKEDKSKGQPNNSKPAIIIKEKSQTTSKQTEPTKKPKPTSNTIEKQSNVTTVNKNTSIDTKKNAALSKPSKAENDCEELDDRDILTLMSGGIILDECCGSDED